MSGPGVTATNAKLENLIKVADRIAAEGGLGLAARETIEEARRAFWAALTMERGEWLLLATRPATTPAFEGAEMPARLRERLDAAIRACRRNSTIEAEPILCHLLAELGAPAPLPPTMWWKDINGHPTVRPALEAWHAMRLRVQTMERAERCDAEALAAAKLAATEAERAYDTAVGMLLSEGAGR